jgi:alginate O-acetyltransferase complex protein AlgI
MPTSAVWLGLTGFVLLVHLGAFHLIALAWRAAGVAVEPIMDRPATAGRLSEFWARRWNRAFHLLAERFVFRPLVRRVGAAGALAAAFLASGLVHDAVISVSAGGGWGLPTAYFAIQGAGVLLERRLGRRLRIDRSPGGRVFAGVVTVAPLPLLFHPRFLSEVGMPLLSAMGAW